MIARLVERTPKPGQANAIVSILENEILPLLREQPGFIDAIRVTDDAHPNCLITLTVWESRDDAENFYSSPHTKSQTERIMPLVESVSIRTCSVETSTFHKFSRSAAA